MRPSGGGAPVGGFAAGGAEAVVVIAQPVMAGVGFAATTGAATATGTGGLGAARTRIAFGTQRPPSPRPCPAGQALPHTRS